MSGCWVSTVFLCLHLTLSLSQSHLSLMVLCLILSFRVPLSSPVPASANLNIIFSSGFNSMKKINNINHLIQFKLRHICYFIIHWSQSINKFFLKCWHFQVVHFSKWYLLSISPSLVVVNSFTMHEPEQNENRKATQKQHIIFIHIEIVI